MGQWGAYGYASEFGWSYKRILAHYYGGTTLATLPAPEPVVTVDLTELHGRNTIAAALPGRELAASWEPGATPATAGRAEAGTVEAGAVEVGRRGGLQYVYTAAKGCAGPWHLVGTSSGPVTIASAAPRTAGASGVGKAASLASVAGSVLDACIAGVGARAYQGWLVAEPAGRTYNDVNLEDYVDGVVPAESPATWASRGGEAALEAQAVAARSFALAVMAAQGLICDDTDCQMYLGLPGQYGRTADTAVAATRGQVLYCGPASTCGPAGTVALAEYSASTGGYTAGGAFPAVADIGDAVPANPLHAWSVGLTLSELDNAFPSIGTYESAEVMARNGLGRIGGRVEEIVVDGTLGSVTLSGAEFAADLGLPSDWFDVGPLRAGATPTTAPGVPTTTSAPPTTFTTAGTTTTTAPPTTPPVPAATTTTEPAQAEAPPGGASGRAGGYWVATGNGSVEAFAGTRYYGGAAGTSLAGRVVAMAALPGGDGYWLAGSNGGVLAFGGAHWYGSASHLHLHHPVVAMAGTPDGRGYWLAARDGSVFAYGDARNYGGLAALHLRLRTAGMAATPDGRGYWLVSTTGAVFAFGDAGFYGSVGADQLAQPVTAMVATPDGKGYFLVARDGGVFAFGDALFEGSLPSERIHARAVAVATSGRGAGYYILSVSGRVYAFGDPGSARRPGADAQPAVSGPLRAGGAVAIVSYRRRS